ncbi:MAG: V-type ATP synthase subunit A [Deltaproteobacteria bacterium]|nr:V-type ATP synthase subunit A [Deltaproteobacteria bacterium]
MTARVVRVTGSLVEARPMRESALFDLVRVGARGLLGEIVRLQGEVATIQVYEETAGLAVGEPVRSTGAALEAELGPGLLGSILDGVGRPLARVADQEGDFVLPGAEAVTLDPDRRFAFEATVQPGARVTGGDVVGLVEERPGFLHPILVPPRVSGIVAEVSSGSFGARDVVAALDDGQALTLAHRWPVREPRPVAEWLRGDRPFVTGQRVLDFLFPVAEGGSVALPGGFGTGKTVIEHSLAKWADADVVVFIGCGERGNEIADVLAELPALLDPRTGRSLIERAILVVNTSNMPVAAREASVQLGLTIAEYYRDLGQRVAVLADSLSRWAEALRELGARLGEMPGEEGYPTTLSDRIGKVFERAGRARVRGAPERQGAVTFIGALSPPGGDFSEPVTQAALRVAGTLWALDPALARQRHFPAVDWATSHSLHAEATAQWFVENTAEDWPELRRETSSLLRRDAELREVTALVGVEALQESDRLVLEAARIVREIVLSQSSFDPNDARSPVMKTHRLAALAIAFHRQGLAALERGTAFARLPIGELRQTMVRMRSAPDDALDELALHANALIDSMGREAEPEKEAAQ